MRKLKNSELNRLSVAAFKKKNKIPVIVILDNVRSLNNIGSVFRSSDAFLVQSVYLCGITATPPHKDIHKTALGATDSVDWKYFENTLIAIDQLKNQGFHLIAVEQTEGSIPLQDFIVNKNQRYALIFGHEVRGVSQEVLDRCDSSIDIPQFGTKHSLNISVCAGIVLWHMVRKFLDDI